MRRSLTSVGSLRLGVISSGRSPGCGVEPPSPGTRRAPGREVLVLRSPATSICTGPRTAARLLSASRGLAARILAGFCASNSASVRTPCCFSSDRKRLLGADRGCSLRAPAAARLRGVAAAGRQLGSGSSTAGRLGLEALRRPGRGPAAIFLPASSPTMGCAGQGRLLLNMCWSPIGFDMRPGSSSTRGGSCSRCSRIRSRSTHTPLWTMPRPRSPAPSSRGHERQQEPLPQTPQGRGTADTERRCALAVPAHRRVRVPVRLPHRRARRARRRGRLALRSRASTRRACSAACSTARRGSSGSRRTGSIIRRRGSTSPGPTSS